MDDENNYEGVIRIADKIIENINTNQPVSIISSDAEGDREIMFTGIKSKQLLKGFLLDLIMLHKAESRSGL